MIASSKYKRFKRINFTSNTLPLSDTRSSIIRMIRRYIHYPNTADLRRFEKQAQINEIQPLKTNKLSSVCDRAFWLFLHLIFEMLPILIFYMRQNTTNYHQCSSMDTDIQMYTLASKKGASMNKDIQ